MFERRLIDYLPEMLREVREYKAITQAEEDIVFGLHDMLRTALDNAFAAHADEYGLSRWEKMLGIVPRSGATTDERRTALLTRLAEQLPYTYRALTRTLTAICGEDGFKISLDAGNYTITVLVGIPAGGVLGEVHDHLKRVCPANLIVYVSIEYNRHITLAAYTHAQLAAKTHYQLRNEVLQ